MPRDPMRQSGFTLAELAIVVVIIGLLLGGLLMPLSMQTELRRITETKRTMDDIREALIGFAIANGRLPCPADPTIADGTANAGVERASCTTAATQVGALPWVTLNVAETDEWGRRFNYRVTQLFADGIGVGPWGCTPSITPTQASFALCSVGDMSINSRNPTNKGAYAMTSTNLPAVFYSAGKNGYGAYTTQGTLFAAVPAANVDETTNATTATTGFISRDKTDYASSCSDTSASPANMCEFDDLVAWVPLTTLMNRMVAAGKLP